MTDLSNKNVLRAIRDTMTTALKVAGDAHKVEFAVGNISFEEDGSRFTAKVECMSRNADGSVVTKDAKAYIDNAEWEKMDPEWLGVEVISDGKRFEITGYKPRSTKYPVLVKVDGKSFKYPAKTIKRIYEEAGK